jgi:hypothetical protein
MGGVMSDFKIDEEVIISKDSSHYTGKYAGTYAQIKKIIKNFYCEVKAYDGHTFSCPIKYLNKKTMLPEIPTSYFKCTCGATKTYGKDCPPYFHFDYCPLYRPKS